MNELTRQELTILGALASAEDRGLDRDMSAMQADAGSDPSVRRARLESLADEGLILIRIGTDHEGTERVYVQRVMPAGRQRLDDERRKGIARQRAAVRRSVLNALYEIVNSVPTIGSVAPEVLADRTALSLDLVRTAVDQLVATGWAEWANLTTVSLTRAGAVEVESRTDAGQATPSHRPDGVIEVWSPSRNGPLDEEDLAEASLLLEDLGSWVGQLPDDDPRVEEAESVAAILRNQLRLGERADRIFVRRAVHVAVRILATEVRAVIAEATEELEPEMAAPIMEGVDVVVGSAERDDDEPWQPGLDQLETAFDRLVASLPSTNEPPLERVGWGGLLRRAAKASGKEVPVRRRHLSSAGRSVCEIPPDRWEPAQGTAPVRSGDG